MATTTAAKPTVIAKKGEPAIAIPNATESQLIALTKLRKQLITTLQELETGAGCVKSTQTYKVSAQTKAFQAVWNAQLSTLKPLYTAAKVNVGPLKVDGKYGPSTSAAAWLCLVDNTGIALSSFPAHACDVAMPANEAVLDVVIARLQLRLVQAFVTPKKRPPLNTTTTTPSKPVANTPVSQPGAGAQADAAATVDQGKGGGIQVDVGEATDVVFLPEETTPVAGTTSKSLSAWVYVAIGAGVLSLGGLAWWKWGRK